MTDTTSSSGSVDWGRALFAGLVATVVMTVTMALSGTNLMKALGMMLAPTAGQTAQYVAGGLLHLLTGLFYAVVYAKFFATVQGWSPTMKGVVYGLVIGGLMFGLMPVMASIMSGGAATPCSPCGPTAAPPSTPCTPPPPLLYSVRRGGRGRSGDSLHPVYPLCGGQEGMATESPCNPCNPCNPCGGGGSPYAGLISLINHIIYGLMLAFLYRGKTA